MEIDLQSFDGDVGSLERRLCAAVCIVGGGIAGLTLAQELLRGGELTVTLIEAGGREGVPPAGVDPFRTELRGRPHAGSRKERVRALGGSSLVWGGQMLPLPEDADWPVSPAELWPERADGAGYAIGEVLGGARLRLPGLLQAVPGLTPRISAFLPFSRRNFRKSIADRLRRSERFRLLLHASAMELQLAPSRDQIVGLELRGAKGQRLSVVADHFILAAGTAETCRLLLASRSVAAEGVGNAHGQVGVNFHDHLTLPAAELVGPARARLLKEFRPWVLSRAGDGTQVRSLKLEPDRALRERLGLLPAMVHLTIEEPEGSGVGVVRAMLRARQGVAAGGSLGSLLGSSLRQLPRALWQALRLLWEARVRRRRYVSPAARVFLQINVAQETPSSARVSLREEVDELGMPRAAVDWRVSAAELRTFRELAEYLRARLAAAGVEEGVLWQPGLFEHGADADAALLDRIDDARHAMGGACMGTDPGTSVVDPRLRVHGIRNLSVASAAVFPNGAAQLPTLTLQALCVRLAKQLRSEIREELRQGLR